MCIRDSPAPLSDFRLPPRSPTAEQVKRYLTEARRIDEDAVSYTHLMVDSNLQRETISPMERAQAYKMKLEALKHQGKRVDLEGRCV